MCSVVCTLTRVLFQLESSHVDECELILFLFDLGWLEYRIFLVMYTADSSQLTPSGASNRLYVDHEASVPSHFRMPHTFRHDSSCELELDVWKCDIVRSHAPNASPSIHASQIAAVHSLSALWEVSLLIRIRII